MPPRALPPTGEIILYPTEDGRSRVECRFAGDTVWLTQALMAELLAISIPTVNEHVKGIYEDQELDPEATIRKFRIVRREGEREVARNLDHYSLDAILAVGYLEAEAEREVIAELEEAAKQLPPPPEPEAHETPLRAQPRLPARRHRVGL